ncbi:DCN1-like protein 4 [Tanacetum coccineum]
MAPALTRTNREVQKRELTEDKQKTLDLESVCLLLDLVLGPKFRQQVDSFSEYLKIQKEYKVINTDQWTNFFRFCHEIEEFPDLTNYDSCQAWPFILDSFVEWLREKTGGTPIHSDCCGLLLNDYTIDVDWPKL